MKIRFTAMIFIASALLFYGCAYRFAGGGELPGAVKIVSIAVLENKTAESGIENIITNDLIYEFTRNGKVVAKKDDADAYLTGTIESANDEAISHKGDHTSLERRVKVVLGLKLKDKPTCAVNPSGGLIACGHPVGATGLMQGVFAIWQLQGTIKKHFKADQLQVKDAKRGAIHSHAGTGTYVSISVLEREG